MINSNIWAVYEPAFTQLSAMIKKGIESGIVDDANRYGLKIQRSGDIAIVSLTGPMVKNESYLTDYYGFSSTVSTQRAIEAAASDGEVNSIVLRIESPGGSVAGLYELGEAVSKAAKIKPVIAQVSDMAASAAYYVASQATEIRINQMGMVGSIGTRLMMYDYSKAYEDAGIKAIPIDTGEFKSAGAEGTVVTDAQIADFQRIVDAYFKDFVQKVAVGRGMTEDQVLKVADGRMFFADEAISFGLVDQISTLDQTLSGLKQERARRTSTAQARIMLNSKMIG